MRYSVMSKKKKLLFVLGWDRKCPSLHCKISLVIPIGDPRDGFFYSNLTLMMAYNIILYNIILYYSIL